MFATALWLLWVFSLQTSTNALIELLLVLLLISLLMWFIINTSKKIIKIILVLLLGSLIIVQVKNLTNVKVEPNNKENKNVLIWTKDIENDLRSKNKAYLINYTAAWCITCQANDKVALSRPNVNISYLIIV